tara:strand:+ start:5257 stop:5883 length:627 start_codon:yes stop_codon:yes gene_type:complete
MPSRSRSRSSSSLPSDLKRLSTKEINDRLSSEIKKGSFMSQELWKAEYEDVEEEHDRRMKSLEKLKQSVIPKPPQSKKGKSSSNPRSKKYKKRKQYVSQSKKLQQMKKLNLDLTRKRRVANQMRKTEINRTIKKLDDENKKLINARSMAFDASKKDIQSSFWYLKYKEFNKIIKKNQDMLKQLRNERDGLQSGGGRRTRRTRRRTRRR